MVMKLIEPGASVGNQEQAGGTTEPSRPQPHLHSVNHEKVDDDSMLGQFIPLHYHGQMLAHSHRMAAFSGAIEALVPRGGRVLEFGGGTGVMSFLASKRAERVYCVERIPHVARAARKFLDMNGAGKKVQVVLSDALDYLPPEPVDAVICEMLHVGLLREKQLQVIGEFKSRYLERFGGPLPAFIPEATILGVQAVQQNYDFSGYHAPIPMFYEPTEHQVATTGLADPELYASFEYANELPTRYAFDRTVKMTSAGTLNALRFVTKNLVAILPEQGKSLDWHMQYLVAPLPRPMRVRSGDRVQIRFRYEAGDSLPTLLDSLSATPLPLAVGRIDC